MTGWLFLGIALKETHLYLTYMYKYIEKCYKYHHKGFLCGMWIALTLRQIDHTFSQCRHCVGETSVWWTIPSWGHELQNNLQLKGFYFLPRNQMWPCDRLNPTSPVLWRLTKVVWLKIYCTRQSGTQLHTRVSQGDPSNLQFSRTHFKLFLRELGGVHSTLQRIVTLMVSGIPKARLQAKAFGKLGSYEICNSKIESSFISGAKPSYLYCLRHFGGWFWKLGLSQTDLEGKW